MSFQGEAALRVRIPYDGYEFIVNSYRKITIFHDGK
jgi:hypothetical protein